MSQNLTFGLVPKDGSSTNAAAKSAVFRNVSAQRFVANNVVASNVVASNVVAEHAVATIFAAPVQNGIGFPINGSPISTKFIGMHQTSGQYLAVTTPTTNLTPIVVPFAFKTLTLSFSSSNCTAWLYAVPYYFDGANWLPLSGQVSPSNPPDLLDNFSLTKFTLDTPQPAGTRIIISLNGSVDNWVYLDCVNIVVICNL